MISGLFPQSWQYWTLTFWSFFQLFFYISPKESTYKKCFLFYQSFIHSQDIQIFALLSILLFSLVSHCWIDKRSWSKISPEIYGVITCLNCNLKRLSFSISWEGKKVWYQNLANRHSIKSGKFSCKNMQKMCTRN